ncbi:DUF2291 family protein [Jiangella anatolica]|uniref:DUF2291 domain-containing protein n=1 Tax=Jiangella anatolica TaxID=2670374 RepID=A0A2W2CEJ1_9ACTN|nr:DUF2291 family protein [Jiangella anatolica]PZF86669.1 hypothetical protein C1I92_00385 [Jiangella anatolica]
MSATHATATWWRRPPVLAGAAGVVLVALMLLDTRFVSAGEEAQAADTAVEYAEQNYESAVVPAVEDAATPLAELVTAIVADPEAAGEEYGHREDDGKPYSYATQATGTLVEGGFGEVGLEVSGLPDGITAGVAIPPLGSSTALRDAGADVSFGDFVNQTEYQNVAIELNAQAVEHVYEGLDLASMVGQTVEVTGAFTWSSDTGGEVDHVTIVPVAIEVAP